MTENEKIQSFGDMVNATEKLTKPWKHFCFALLIALIATNAFWALVHWKQLQYAYMTPEEFEQIQEFESQTQSQSHSAGVTDDK